jgi:hypothetical protein
MRGIARGPTGHRYYATTGNPLLEAALKGVARQTYQPIQHLVIIDGSERSPAARGLFQPDRST